MKTILISLLSLNLFATIDYKFPAEKNKDILGDRMTEIWGSIVTPEMVEGECE